jgi:hypothetical protein
MSSDFFKNMLELQKLQFLAKFLKNLKFKEHMGIV